MNRVTPLTTPAGEELVVVPKADYERLIEAAEELADIAAIDEADRRLAAGEEERVPDEIVGRLLDGENPVRVWREHRGLSANALAERAGLCQSYVSQIETGKRDGTMAAMSAIAKALGIGLDDLAP